MIHLKCTAVRYANLNSSSLNNHYLRAIKDAISLFLISYLCFFNETFVKSFMKKVSFLMQIPKFISRCSILWNIRMSNLVILKRRPFEYEEKFEKRPFLFRFEIGILDMSFKKTVRRNC